jgi:hypothetical protein
MKKLAISISVAALLTSCSSTRVVKVISDPPGAHVSINGNYIGQTPLETKLNDGASGKFWLGTEKQNTIEVNPASQSSHVGQCGQYRRFQGTELPESVFFNMFEGCSPRGAASSTPTINNYNIQGGANSPSTINPAR